MKRTLITAAALVAFAGTQAFAQNAKEGVITFALTSQAQNSVSTSTAANAGLWSQIPKYYKTVGGKVTTANIIQDIAYVLHNKNNNFYGSKSQLVLVQGELSGFFNLTPELADAKTLTGETAAIRFPGLFDMTPSFTTTTLDRQGTFAQLATGRHLLTVPEGYATTGAYPVGHHQPWGQIFVKVYDAKGVVTLCDNVTPFFAITVEECYDCFYLNSFISDATFRYQSGASGLPCCTTPTSLLGSGKDRYYMTLSFDNTINNPYLNPQSAGYAGSWGQSIDRFGVAFNLYRGVIGFGFNLLPGDGTTPDFLRYYDSIRSGAAAFNPYGARFTLNGIVTYTWNLKFVNSGDSFADFVGSASYAANGYGFIGLRCSLLTGSASIAERIVKVSNCCLDDPWYDSWYGIGWNQAQDPWGDFFESPINTEPDLSFHAGFDEEYEPGEQWNTNPLPDVTVPTTWGPDVFVPVGR